MSTANRRPLVTLGWQAWAILAVVVALVLIAGAYLMIE
jgi:hypothetical protein